MSPCDPFRPVKRSHVDPLHTARAGSRDAEVAVFPDHAPLRPGAQPAGGLEEWIGVGLVLVGVFAGHDRVEAIGNPHPFEDLQADVSIAPRDHRHRHAAARPQHHVHHGIDRLDAIELGEERGLLHVHSVVDVDLDAPLAGERRDDVAGGPAAH